MGGAGDAPGRRSRRRTLTFGIVWTAGGLLLFGACAACPISNTFILRPIFATLNLDGSYTKPGVPPAPFDREKWRWKNARERVAMARHFKNTNALDGKTRAEVVEMLGEPDIDKPGDEGMRWLLGYYAKGLFDESLWLCMTIQEDGTVSGAIVWTDWYDPRRK